MPCLVWWLALPQKGEEEAVSDMDEAIVIERIEALRIEHRDLDSAIDALALHPQADQLQLVRLKRRKLALKDQLAKLEASLIPDIIA